MVSKGQYWLCQHLVQCLVFSSMCKVWSVQGGTGCVNTCQGLIMVTQTLLRLGLSAACTCNLARMLGVSILKRNIKYKGYIKKIVEFGDELETNVKERIKKKSRLVN